MIKAWNNSKMTSDASSGQNLHFFCYSENSFLQL